LSAEIQYLHHSGFSVKTKNHFLVFDYDGSPENYDRPVFEKNAIVFASHRHGDHYSKAVHNWKQQNPELTLVLSYDIPSKGDSVSIRPDETITLGDVTVTALGSTDEGVAFLVKVDGVTVYHAGDLNWWHWNGESEEYNADMAKNYRREIEKLKGMQIDFAFVPLDPRLEDAYLYGVDLFAQTADASVIFPMHLWENYSTVKRLKKETRAAGYAARVVEIKTPGEIFRF